MMEGELIFRSTDPVYTQPWSGNIANATFAVNVTQKNGLDPSLAIDIEDRNRDEAEWKPVTSFAAITTTGLHTKDVTALLRDYARLKLTLSGTSGTPGPWIRVTILPPSRPFKP